MVPDEASRGSIDQLLYEMDTNGVEQAAVVCAAIGGNPDNTAYAAFARDRRPDRFHVIGDLDCTWSTTYHVPGAADRLRALDDEFSLAGFTHYVRSENDGWLRSDEAERLFALAEQRNILVSFAGSPAWQADLREIAARHPGLAVLCHHLGGVRVDERGELIGLDEVLASAAVENLYIKVSGFHYASVQGWDHPWNAALEIFRRLYETFGPARLCWGSDFPASKRFCTYLQALEVVRIHAGFLSAGDRDQILGGSLAAVLDRRRSR
jgi:predicted TIM-barrel fold metal-dependent hydrolase